MRLHYPEHLKFPGKKYISTEQLSVVAFVHSQKQDSSTPSSETDEHVIFLFLFHNPEYVFMYSIFLM